LPFLFGGDVLCPRRSYTTSLFAGRDFAMRDSVSRRQNATPRRAQRSAIPSSRLWIESLRQKRRAE
jgi:hypothetical protein